MDVRRHGGGRCRGCARFFLIPEGLKGEVKDGGEGAVSKEIRRNTMESIIGIF